MFTLALKPSLATSHSSECLRCLQAQMLSQTSSLKAGLNHINLISFRYLYLYIVERGSFILQYHY